MVFFGCENFLTGPLLDQNPNEVDDVTVVSPEALLVGTQSHNVWSDGRIFKSSSFYGHAADVRTSNRLLQRL